jgi:hypothetical protein
VVPFKLSKVDSGSREFAVQASDLITTIRADLDNVIFIAANDGTIDNPATQAAAAGDSRTGAKQFESHLYLLFPYILTISQQENKETGL